MRLRHAAASNVGLVRSQNEDTYIVGGGLFAVCDGMGGARAGEVASETACRLLLALNPAVTDAEAMRRAVREANEAILHRGREDPGLRGMGTTMTAALHRGGSLLIGHVGDSRAYLWQTGQMRQLTEDHSLVGELMRQGRLTPEQAANHPHRSIITRALGTEASVEPDVFEVVLEPGDRVLLCTDGLSGMVADADLAGMLGRAADPQQAAQDLVDAALAAGGEDNITVVVVFTEEGERPLDEAARMGPEARTAAPLSGRGPGGTRSLRLPYSRRRLAVAGLIAVLLLLVGAAGFWAFVTSVYFVGLESGEVALYRGLPYHLLGVQLYRVIETAPTPFAQLNEQVRQRVVSHELLTREEGQRFIRGLASEP